MGTLPIVAPTGGLKDTVEARRRDGETAGLSAVSGIPYFGIIAQERSLTLLVCLGD